MPSLALVSAPSPVLAPFYILLGLEAEKGSAEGSGSLACDQSGSGMGGWVGLFFNRQKGDAHGDYEES